MGVGAGDGPSQDNSVPGCFPDSEAPFLQPPAGLSLLGSRSFPLLPSQPGNPAYPSRSTPESPLSGRTAPLPDLTWLHGSPRTVTLSSTSDSGEKSPLVSLQQTKNLGRHSPVTWGLH